MRVCKLLLLLVFFIILHDVLEPLKREHFRASGTGFDFGGGFFLYLCHQLSIGWHTKNTFHRNFFNSFFAGVLSHFCSLNSSKEQLGTSIELGTGEITAKTNTTNYAICAYSTSFPPATVPCPSRTYRARLGLPLDRSIKLTNDGALFGESFG